MKDKKSKIFIGIVLAFLMMGCGEEVGSSSQAPEFTVSDIHGEKVTLSDYRGKIVVLDFWATWCPPCRLAIPELVELQEKYGDRGLVVLGFSMDDPRSVNDKFLLAFMKKFSINYTVLRGTGELVRDYFGNENIALPTMFVIDQDGRIADKHVGFYPGAVEGSVKKLLQ